MRIPIITPQAALFALALLAPIDSAQVATSPFFELHAFELAPLGGGAASASHASFLALSDLASEELTSPLYTATLGFLGANDPMPTNAPVIFGVSPALGHKSGGTPLTITGMNFGVFGGGAAVDVGGQTASGVVVSSSTEIQALAPPNLSGPADVGVTSAFGTGTLPGGFLYTPAVVASPSAPLGGTLLLEHYGQPGALVGTSLSLTTTSIPLGAWGTLLIGPSGIIEVVKATPYSPIDGTLDVPIPVTSNPSFLGVTVYFQSAEIVVAPALAITFTNRTQTVLF